MNFLAHYILASDRDSAAFHLGALLPDMARRAGVSLDPSRLFHKDASDFEEMRAGIHLHWHADRHFHNSAFFHEGYLLWKNELEPGIGHMNRKFFLYHLLFEMWLDRLLMRSNEVHAPAMYNSLLRLDERDIAGFSGRFLSDSPGRLQETVSDFKERKFILQYAENERFAAIASGVFAHATGQQPDQELKSLLMEVLPGFDQEHALPVEAEWQKFQKELLTGWKYPF